VTDGEVVVGESEKLADWLEGMSPRLGRLENFELPEDFSLDYSPESLSRLEALILDRFPDSKRLTADSAEAFVEAAAAYVGEVLLRAGGGSWGWDAAAVEGLSYDLPCVRPDAELGLGSVSPLGLIVRAVNLRTFREFVDVHASVEQAVGLRKAKDPSWVPTKELTPGVDERLGPVPQPAALASWLTEREKRFPRWIAEHADPDTSWDFTEASVDALEDLTRRKLQSPEDAEADLHHEFMEGAAWYLGEVMCRLKGGQWRYNHGEPDPHNPWLGRPYIKQMIADGYGIVPILLIKYLHRMDPGALREQLWRFKT
jgi:hypothetical protein